MRTRDLPYWTSLGACGPTLFVSDNLRPHGQDVFGRGWQMWSAKEITEIIFRSTARVPRWGVIAFVSQRQNEKMIQRPGIAGWSARF